MSIIARSLHAILEEPRNFSGTQARNYLDAAPDYPGYAAVLFLACVFYLPQYLKKRNKVYKLKYLVAGWNLFFSLVSSLGAYHCIGMVADAWRERGFYMTACSIYQTEEDAALRGSIADTFNSTIPNHYFNPARAATAFDRSDIHKDNPRITTYYSTTLDHYYKGPRVFFLVLFMYLKTPELLDTVFLILQGKPVSFLHWYHHIATAIFCWHASYVPVPSGVFFATMNYCVHSIMYFYYFLVTMGLRAKIRPFAPVITILQVLQMFIGMGITVYTYLQYWLSPSKSDTLFYTFFSTIFSAAHFVYAEAASVLSGRGWVSHEQVAPLNMAEYFGGCQTDTTNMRMGMMMYGSYCVLFVVLFKELYLDRRASKRSLVLARRASKEMKKPSPNNGAKRKSEREKSA